MKKRIIAALLWFYAGWYAGALIADFLHVSPLIGPFLGAVAAALIAGDPRRIIWKAKVEDAPAASAAAQEIAKAA
jgi:hypothetical protein